MAKNQQYHDGDHLIVRKEKRPDNIPECTIRGAPCVCSGSSSAACVMSMPAACSTTQLVGCHTSSSISTLPFTAYGAWGAVAKHQHVDTIAVTRGMVSDAVRHTTCVSHESGMEYVPQVLELCVRQPGRQGLVKGFTAKC